MQKLGLIILLSTLSCTACVVPTGPVEVTRFNRAEEGISYGSGTYSVKLPDHLAGQVDLAASPYLSAVSREMQRIGYSMPDDATTATDIVAEVDFGTSETQAAKRSPVSVGLGGSTGGHHSGVGLGIGLNLGGGTKAQVETYLSVRIMRSSDMLIIWEGRATQQAKKGSPAAQPGIAASKLAESLFTNFPGKSGENITIP